MKYFLFLLFLLLPALAHADCLLVPLAGDGSDASPYRPNLPAIVNQIPGIKWTAHIPSNPDGSPKYKDAYVCFPQTLQLPPGVANKLSSAAAKAEILKRDSAVDFNMMDKLPPAVIKGSWQDYIGRVYRFAAKHLGAAVAWAASATENFTGTGALSANWSGGYGTEGTPTRVSDVADCALATRCVASYNALVPGNNQYAQGVIAQLSSPLNVDSDAGPAVRMAAPSTFSGYFARAGLPANPLTTIIQKRVSGSGTNIATESATSWVISDVVYIEASGTAITLKRNGSTLLTATDSDLTSGRGGILLNSLNSSGSSDNAQIDNFEVGDLGGAVATRRRVVVIQ